MSTIIPIDTLTEVQLKQIQDMLSIVPIDKEEEERKKWNKMAASKIPSKPKEIIPMFQIDYIDGKPYVRIPFRFGSAFLNKLANRDEDKLKNYVRVNYKFEAKLRPSQIPVAEEAYKQLAATGTTTLCLPTGFGKTLLSLYLAGLTKGIIAVNITIQALTDSWLSTFLKCYPDMKDRIWVVGENDMPADPAFILFMYTRYEKIPQDLRKRISCLVIDEAHLHCTIGKVPALLSITPKFVIACTATLERNDGLETMMHTLVGTHNIERLSENPFTMIKLKTGIKIEEESSRLGQLDYSKFVNKQAECLERNLMAVNIINGNKHRKFMILTKTKEHVNNLETLFKHYGLPCTTYFGNKKSYKDEKILIGSLGKISTGFDMATASEDFDGVNADVLILMTSIKKEPLLKQTIGRVVGRSDNPTIIYFIDNNGTQSRHFNSNKTMIEKCKGEIKTIEYDGSVAGGGIVLK
jgi:superfamily II DNA or RNA helicase